MIVSNATPILQRLAGQILANILSDLPTDPTIKIIIDAGFLPYLQNIILNNKVTGLGPILAVCSHAAAFVPEFWDEIGIGQFIDMLLAVFRTGSNTPSSTISHSIFILQKTPVGEIRRYLSSLFIMSSDTTRQFLTRTLHEVVHEILVKSDASSKFIEALIDPSLVSTIIKSYHVSCLPQEIEVVRCRTLSALYGDHIDRVSINAEVLATLKLQYERVNTPKGMTYLCQSISSTINRCSDLSLVIDSGLIPLLLSSENGDAIANCLISITMDAIEKSRFLYLQCLYDHGIVQFLLPNLKPYVMKTSTSEKLYWSALHDEISTCLKSFLQVKKEFRKPIERMSMSPDFNLYKFAKKLLHEIIEEEKE